MTRTKRNTESKPDSSQSRLSALLCYFINSITLFSPTTREFCDVQSFLFQYLGGASHSNPLWCLIIVLNTLISAALGVKYIHFSPLIKGDSKIPTPSLFSNNENTPIISFIKLISYPLSICIFENKNLYQFMFISPSYSYEVI